MTTFGTILVHSVISTGAVGFIGSDDIQGRLFNAIRLGKVSQVQALGLRFTDITLEIYVDTVRLSLLLDEHARVHVANGTGYYFDAIGQSCHATFSVELGVLQDVLTIKEDIANRVNVVSFIVIFVIKLCLLQVVGAEKP